MRLTIRTLLGYMDDILDRQDAEEIGKRIEESEVATGLFHRVRDVTRRLSLKAPDLEDEGDGLDPNTVAEYLDNVLPDDRVPDFEKVCLDSDMHLAEVAACHQILAVALGEAAEIDIASREHMYQLPQVAADLDKMERPPSDPLGMAGGGEGEAVANIPKRPTPIVPDYLREKQRRLPVVPIVMGGIVVVCLVVVGLALGGFLAPLGIGPSGEPGTEVAQNDVNQNDEQGVLDQPSDETPEEPAQDAGNEATSEEPSVAGQSKDVASIPGAKTDDLSDKPSPTEVTEPDTTLLTEDTNANTPNFPGVAGSLTTPVAGDLAPNPVPINPTAPSDLGGLASSETPSGEASPAEDAAEDAESKTPALIGRFVSESQALVQLDPTDGAWKVVPQQGVLTTATSMVALPTFRPIIATASGLSVQLLSETQVTMQPTGVEAMPVLKLQNGRIVLRSLGKSDLRLLLTAGDKTGVVTLVNPDSAAAVELAFHRKRGSDPVEVPSEVELDLFAISGTILWEEGPQSQPLKIDASERVCFTSGEAKPKVEVLAQLPEWIAVPPISKLDQNASEEILRALKDNNIASLALRELLDHRQREVSRLALRCLTQLGEFDTAVRSLDNPSQRLVWDPSISQLFDLATRSPAVALEVRHAFERVYGDSSPDLWRMFWGYTTEQLKNDGAIELVEYLENDRLAFRVMSFYNLKEITGKSLYYKPEETPVRRNTPTQRWQKELQKGKIVLQGEE